MPPGLPLTAREAQVLRAVGQRMTNAEIAGHLVISVRTVESHVSSLLRKLQVADRRGLVDHARGAASGTAPPVALVGRDRVVEQVRRLTADGGLVTLVGPGGVGKTSVARAASTGAGWFVDLTTLPPGAGADLVASAALAAAGRDEVGERPPVEDLGRLAADGDLLVLDNCEHVLDGAATVVADLLADRGATVLATSRERLAVAGEQVVVLDPLADEAAVALFVARARVAAPDEQLDLEVVARICARLEGLPLAVELAAARLALLPLRDLEAALGAGTDVLDGGARSVPRQRSVRATLGWSHDLLDAPEQACHRRLSVLAGPFSVGTAAAVAAGPPVRSVAASVARLVEASLLARVGDRYRQLDLVRDDAADRLEAAGERADAEDRLLAWAATAAADGGPADDPDLRAAGAVAARRGGPGAGALLETLGVRWSQSHAASEAVVDLEQAAELTGRARPALLAADLLLARWRGDESVRLLRRAADLARRDRDPAAEATALAGEVEVRTRFRGTVSTSPDRSLPELADAAAAAADRSAAPDVRCLALVAQAWAQLDAAESAGGAARAAGVAHAAATASDAAAAAERAGDPVLTSRALDVVSAAAEAAVDAPAVLAANERRVLLLDRLTGSPRGELEHTDALNMATDAARGVGDFRLARDRALMVLAREQARGLPHVGWGRLAMAELFLGAFDDCAEHARLAVDWTRQDDSARLARGWSRGRPGRPARSGWLGGTVVVGMAVDAYRGRDLGPWRAMLATIDPAAEERPFGRALAADAHLFHGRREAAAALVREPADRLGGVARSLYAAVRAEVLGGDAVDEARRLLGGNRHAEAVLARAEGRLDQAAEGFAACGARFEELRTRVAADDEAARAELDRLLAG